MSSDNAGITRNASTDLSNEYYDEKNQTSRESSIGAPENVLKAQMFMMNTFIAEGIKRTVMQNAHEDAVAEAKKKQAIASVINSLAAPR